jgi:hypothetical protein
MVMERRSSNDAADDGRAIRIHHNRALPQPGIFHGLRADFGDELVSTTTAPLATAVGPIFRLTPPPALKSAMSTPSEALEATRS